VNDLRWGDVPRWVVTIGRSPLAIENQPLHNAKLSDGGLNIADLRGTVPVTIRSLLGNALLREARLGGHVDV